MHKRNRIVSLKKDNLSQRSCQNELSQPSLPRIELECQGFESRKDSHSSKFEQMPQIFVKLSFRELCDSELSALHPFDTIVKPA